jgi:hypothetical protein
MRLQGHLTDYPLRDLLTILTNRRETGRLQIDFESAAAVFHFKGGKLIGARVGPLEGFSAVNLALSLAEAPFHFEALATAPEPTINNPSERLMLTRLLNIRVEDGVKSDSREPLPSRTRRPINKQDEIGRAETGGLPVSNNPVRILPTAKETLTHVRRHAPVASTGAIINTNRMLAAAKETLIYVRRRARAASAVAIINTNRMLAAAKETLTYVHRRAQAASAAAIINTNRMLAAAKETLTYVHRHALAASVAAVLLLVVPAVIAITVRLGRDDGRPGPAVFAQASNHAPASPADSGQSRANKSEKPTDNSRHTAQEPTAKPKSPTPKLKMAPSSAAPANMSSDQKSLPPNEQSPPQNSSKLIVVVVQIEGGRVTEAYVKDHRPGLEAYEATAIRLARQRRYSNDKIGTQTTVVKVTSDQ